MASNTATGYYAIPYLLTFAADGKNVKPGRGNAGWTIARFATWEQAEAFMDAHPEAEVMAWKRIRADHNVASVDNPARRFW